MGRLIPNKKEILKGHDEVLVDIYLGLEKTRGPWKNDN